MWVCLIPTMRTGICFLFSDWPTDTEGHLWAWPDPTMQNWRILGGARLSWRIGKEWAFFCFKGISDRSPVIVSWCFCFAYAYFDYLYQHTSMDVENSDYKCGFFVDTVLNCRFYGESRHANRQLWSYALRYETIRARATRYIKFSEIPGFLNNG